MSAVNVLEFCTSLTSTAGTADGEVVQTIGYRTRGDGGEGLFYWDATSTDAANGGTIFGTFTPSGRWKRILPSPTYRNVRWFGAYGNNVDDDTDAIQDTLRSLAGYVFGAEVFIPPGTYKITRTLRAFYGSVDSPYANLTIRGQAVASTNGATILKWHGPSDDPRATALPPDTRFIIPASAFEPETKGSVLLQFAAKNSTLEYLQFQVAPGHSCGCLVNFGYDPDQTPQAITQQDLRCCQFVAAPMSPQGQPITG